MNASPDHSHRHVFPNFFTSASPSVATSPFLEKKLHEAHGGPSQSPGALTSLSRAHTTASSGQRRRRPVYTALHQSIVDARIHQVYLLVNKCSADVNSQDLFGRTPLMLCCLLEDVNTARRMAGILMHSPNINLDLRDHLGRSALAYACIGGRVSLCKALLASDSDDFSGADNDGNTPLHHAAANGAPLSVVIKLVDTFLKFDVNVDLLNHFGYSPLLLAIKNGHFPIALLLLLRGKASPSIRDSEHFLNATGWFDKVCKSRKRSFNKTNESVRPRILHERANTTMSTFYKDLVNPVLRDSMMQIEFHTLPNLPQMPQSSRERTPVGANFFSPTSEQPEKVSIELRLYEQDDVIIDAATIAAMSEEKVQQVLLSLLKKAPRKPPQSKALTHPENDSHLAPPATKLKSTKKQSKAESQKQQQAAAAAAAASSPSSETAAIRPNTAQLMRYRVASSCSSAETVRRLLNAYSSAVNALPPAKPASPTMFIRVAADKRSSPRSSRRQSIIQPSSPEERRLSITKK